MSKKTKPSSPKARKKKTAGKASFQERQRQAVQRMVRQVYAWRYVDHALADARHPIPAHHQGYNVLSLATQDTIDTAYSIATETMQHWQALVVAYFENDQGEQSKGWAWVTSANPVIAVGDGITPLINQGNDIAMSMAEDTDQCYARAVVMAPWSRAHGVHPRQIAARLKSRLALTDDDIASLDEWEAPETIETATEDVDLEVARALTEAETAEMEATTSGITGDREASTSEEATYARA